MRLKKEDRRLKNQIIKLQGEKEDPTFTRVAFFAPLQLLLTINIHLDLSIIFCSSFPQAGVLSLWAETQMTQLLLRVARFC